MCEAVIHVPTPQVLGLCEGRKYSQNGEDGVTLALVASVPDILHVAVEFGVGAGTTCCTRVLRDDLDWDYFWFDAEYGGAGVCRAALTAENIEAEFDAAGVPQDIGVLAIDVDGMDYWLWRALRRRAAIVICEYNGYFEGATAAETVDYSPAFKWISGTDYFGCTLDGLVRLARARGMGLVYCDKTGTNAFFVRGALGAEPAAVYRRQARGPAAHLPGAWRLIAPDGEPSGVVVTI